MDRKTLPAAAFVFLLVAGVVVFVMLSRDFLQPGNNPAPQDLPDEPSPHLTMGNPSRAADDAGDRDNFLMRKTYYALSYNNAAGTPNWVSWCLKEGDFGPAKRALQFAPDADLPKAFKHVTSHDYNDCGFDRGHMCPRSDRTDTQDAANATFVMTNVIPQSPHCNQRAWADLEDYCRTLVKQKHQTLYILSGPQGKGGEGSKGPADAVANGKVAVPAKCWKVVMALDGGAGDSGDVGKVNSETRLFAVVMPNDQSVGHGWAKYRASVKEVESLTGYRFFDRVPAEVVEPLKDRVDDVHIPAARHPRAED